MARARRKSTCSETGRFRHAKKKIVLRTEETWAEKEQRNLGRLEKKGIPGPRPLAREENIVVMSFLGQNGIAAPQLSTLKNTSLFEVADPVLRVVRDLVMKAGLIHGDLSGYNILLWKKTPYLIDLSQAVLTTHPDARFLLCRDMDRITEFFSRIAVDTKPFRVLREELLQEVEGTPPSVEIDFIG